MFYFMAMKYGLLVPQGWRMDLVGISDPVEAYETMTRVGREAEALGFDSIWLFDHFHTVPRPTDEITFESFTSLSALAAQTRRVRIGHIVICTAFRNPALTAKMISTMDVISDGRMELGIGAGAMACGGSDPSGRQGHLIPVLGLPPDLVDRPCPSRA